uniref:molecular chaperone DnaJ n=1 Tax=uncultured Tenacibaculum sp. TaxID=174713 RepID=UPI002604D168|nr:molecular chaperone DnaJ [uncultured Tenacibaculum sp.]
MKDTLIQDSIKVAEKAITSATENETTTNYWMWIALGELVIIFGLILTRSFSKKQSAKQRFKEESLAQEVDFNNIISSSFHSTELYDKLKVKCHPDRFPTDPELNKIADNIFQEITKNKTNLKRLQELKIEAEHKLNINF